MPGHMILKPKLHKDKDQKAIWLSGFHFARDKAKLLENNIGAIVSATDLGLDYPVPDNMKLILNILDEPHQDISQHFQLVFQFIQQRRHNTNILIHCAYGVSRSTTLLAAYIMKKYGMSLETTMKNIRAKRVIVNPNKGFMDQLKKLEQNIIECKNQSS